MLRLLLIIWALALAAAPASAQSFPNRPITLVVSFAPGGSTSIVARAVADKMGEALGQTVVVENRAGGGGTVGTRQVASSLPDGYTLLLGYTGTLAIAPTLYPNPGYDPRKSFAPIGLIGNAPNSLVVNPSFPAKSVRELISYAKANPGKVNMASAGNASAGHLSGELFKMMAGVNLVHVPYRGNGPALTDLLGGQVEVLFASLPSSIEYIKAGKLRDLGITSAKRSEALPDLPTIGEFVPGYEMSAWFGVGVPKGTPAEVIDKINKEINAALADPKMKARFTDLGGIAIGGSPADFGKLIADETEKWAKVVRAANIKAD